MTHRQTETETERQRQRDRQTDRQTDRNKKAEKGTSNIIVCHEILTLKSCTYIHVDEIFAESHEAVCHICF